ncbi:MAG: Mut7-C RNAse domain-containing protein [Desulfobacterales bacterium]
MSAPRPHHARFRFYEELNDFLPPGRRKQETTCAFSGHPSVKDLIEGQGVPHAEVDLILINGRSVGFDHPVHGGDRVAVYPVFESLDITPLIRLRPRPLRNSRFVLDVHLGKLARYLRLLGFDANYGNDRSDPEIIQAAEREDRIILTRDRSLLKSGRVTRGYWIRETQPERQIGEVLRRFDLFSQANPFSRCTACNGLLEAALKDAISDRLEPRTAKYFDTFFRCTGCGRIYWKGSHFDALEGRVAKWLGRG